MNNGKALPPAPAFPSTGARALGTVAGPAPAPGQPPQTHAVLTPVALLDIDFQLNGQAAHLRCAPETRLLGLLRQHFGLTGAKQGCEVGRCGACMVWLDGQPVNACLVMAWQLPGRSVTTIEALAQDPASAPVREALDHGGAVQCGYCSAGMVVSLTHLHQQQPRPSQQAARAAMCGNLCRCTGYGGVERALQQLFAPD